MSALSDDLAAAKAAKPASEHAPQTRHTDSQRRSRNGRLMIIAACVLAVPVLAVAWFIIGVDLMAIV